MAVSRRGQREWGGMSKLFNKLLAKAGVVEPRRDRDAAAQTRASLPDAELGEDPVLYRETAHHGMPTHSTAACFDSVQGLLAVGTKDGAVKVFGKRGVERLLSPPAPPAPASCAEFAQGLGYLAVGTQLPALYVWDLRDSRRVRCVSIQLPDCPVCLHAPTGAGSLNIGTAGSEVLFFRFGEASLCEYKICAADLSFGAGPTDIVAACSHPGGALTLLVAGRAGHLVTWDMRARAIARKYVGAGTGVELRQAAWSPDARVVAAAYADGVIQLWAAGDGKAVLSRLEAGRAVLQMSWSALGDAAAAAAAASSRRERRDPKASPDADSFALVVLAGCTADGGGAAAAGREKAGADDTAVVLFSGAGCEHKEGARADNVSCRVAHVWRMCGACAAHVYLNPEP